MSIDEARATMNVVEIASTTLSPAQMVGFHAGWKLAHESEVDYLTQGTVDCLNDLLADDGRYTDFQLGKLVGWASYWEKLLGAMQ